MAIEARVVQLGGDDSRFLSMPQWMRETLQPIPST